MRHRTRERSYEEEPPHTWVVYAFAMLLVGGIAGYVLSATTSPQFRTGPAATPALFSASQPVGTVLDESALRAYRDVLTREPGNVQAAVGAGNLLYDAKHYGEAVPYYQQALAVTNDINVSTDLGTALWYSGRAEEALAQYGKSLAIDPAHAQTLFNMGIVKSDGKHDYRGAVQAWQTLLEKNPGYPSATAVRTMIGEAQKKIGGF